MGQGESSTKKTRGPAELSVDTSKLTPKVKKWLEDAEEQYTSCSKEKADPSNQLQSQSQPQLPQQAIKSREVEIVALEKLLFILPMFPHNKIRHLFAPNEIERFEKLMYEPDVWPIIFCLEELQCAMNKSSVKVSKNQELLSTRLLEANLLSTKVLHNTSMLASELQNFESKLKTITTIEHELKTIQEKLNTALRKAFKIFDALSDDEAIIAGNLGMGTAIPILCPLEVTEPYLRKEEYTTTNLLKLTSWFLNRSPEEIQKQRIQEDFWLDTVLPNWDNYMKANPRFWRKGIPYRLRGHVWKRLVHNHAGLTIETYMEIQTKMHELREKWKRENAARKNRKNTDEDVDIYEDGDEDFSETTTTSPSSSNIITIQKHRRMERDTRALIQRDLPRTFPELHLFKNPESDPYNQILKVLETAAFYLPTIGYVQGMSYVAAALLLYMNHFDSFVCFTNLLNSPFMTSVCRIELANLAKHSQLFQIIFAQYAPELYEHFNNLNITTEHFLLEWWLTLFTKSADVPIFSRILDCFFLEGEIVVHYISVGMLLQFEKELLNSQFEACIDLVQQLPKRVNEQALFASLEQFVITPKIQAIMEEMHNDLVL